MDEGAFIKLPKIPSLLFLHFFIEYKTEADFLNQFLPTVFKNKRGFMSTEKRKIDENTLDALLHLSRLSPESTNMEVLKGQVDQIVEYFDILSQYDDSQNPYDAYPSTVATELRDDEIVKGLEIPDVKKMTSEFMDGYFRVPKVLGEGA